MSYNIKIVDGDTNSPLQGTLTYLDAIGNGFATQEIPVEGMALNDTLVVKAAAMSISSPGYLSAIADAGYFDGGNTIAIFKDTTAVHHSLWWLWVLAGLYAGYKLKLFKL